MMKLSSLTVRLGAASLLELSGGDQDQEASRAS